MKKLFLALIFIPATLCTHWPEDFADLHSQEEDETDILEREEQILTIRKNLILTAKLLSHCFQYLTLLETEKKIKNKELFDWGQNKCLDSLTSLHTHIDLSDTFSIPETLEFITLSYNSLTHMIAAFNPHFIPGTRYERLPLLPFPDYKTQPITPTEIARFNKLLRTTKKSLKMAFLKSRVWSVVPRLPRLITRCAK